MIRFFIFILIFSFSSLIAKNQLKTIGKNRYIKLKQLKPYFPGLSIKLEKNSLLAKIIYKKKKIYFRVGNPFYVYNQEIERVSKSILYMRQEFFIPPDFVEAIFINLIEKEVLYEYKGRNLYFELKSRDRKIVKSLKRRKLPASKSKLTVVIDPGHGGKDPGTSSKLYYEKDYVLKIGLLLKKYLQSVAKRKVYITRNRDYFLSLERRAKIANQKLKTNEKAIFISLHCNASLSSRIRGFEIYYLSQNPTTEKDRELSLIKNKLIHSRYLRRDIKQIQAGLMSSLIQRRSRLLAYKINYAFKNKLRNYIYSRGVKKADFAVLRWSLMPAILVELGYISNYREAKLLQRKKIIQKLFKGIQIGIINYERSIR